MKMDKAGQLSKNQRNRQVKNALAEPDNYRRTLQRQRVAGAIDITDNQETVGNYIGEEELWEQGQCRIWPGALQPLEKITGNHNCQNRGIAPGHLSRKSWQF